MLTLSKQQTLRMIRNCKSLESTPRVLIDHLRNLNAAERREKIRVNDPRRFAAINQYEQFMVSFQNRIHKTLGKGEIFYMG